MSKKSHDAHPTITSDHDTMDIQQSFFEEIVSRQTPALIFSPTVTNERSTKTKQRVKNFSRVDQQQQEQTTPQKKHFLRRSVAVSNNHDAGNDGDKEDEVNDERHCESTKKDSSKTPAVISIVKQLKSFKKNEFDDDSGSDNVINSKLRPTVVLRSSSRLRKTSELVKRKWDDDVPVALNSTRKRAIRNKTPNRDHLIAAAASNNNAPRKEEDSLQGLNQSSSQGCSTTSICFTKRLEEQSKVKPLQLTRSTSMPMAPIIKPVALRPSSSFGPLDMKHSPIASEQTVLAPMNITPKATASAFNRFKASAKEINQEDEMDVFFNSPTVKTVAKMQLASANKSRRAISPTPRNSTLLNLADLTSDSSEQDDVELPMIKSMAKYVNSPFKSLAEYSIFNRSILNNSSSNSNNNNNKKASGLNRNLFNNNRLDNVSMLTDKLNFSILHSPVKNQNYASRINDLSKKSLENSSDGDDEIASNRNAKNLGNRRYKDSTDDSADEGNGPIACFEQNSINKNEFSMTAVKFYTALMLVFKFLRKHTGHTRDVLNAARVCKVWRHAAESVLWEAPAFIKVSAMLKMHRHIHGIADLSAASTPQEFFAGTTKTSRATLVGKKRSGVYEMFGIADPSSPRKLLFPDGAAIPTPEKEQHYHQNGGAAAPFSVPLTSPINIAKDYTNSSNNNSSSSNGNNNSNITNDSNSSGTCSSDKKHSARQLAKLVKSISFHLFYPQDKRFPPSFDVQAFLTDTFPNLAALSFSGTPAWINPYLFSRITSGSLRWTLESLELTGGAMDRLIAGDAGRGG
ncbi:hypothetical protein HK100_005129, partial [Physocladia obscura]